MQHQQTERTHCAPRRRGLLFLGIKTMFDNDDLMGYEEMFAAVDNIAARSRDWSVQFVERHPEEGLLDFDEEQLLTEPKVGSTGSWYRITEILEIDREGKTAKVVFEFTEI